MYKHLRLILPLTLVIISTTLTRQSYADRNREGKLKQGVSKELDAGNLAYKSKDYLKAIGHYKNAYRLIPDDQTLHQIASAYDLLPNSCEEALQAWKKLDQSCQSCVLKSKIQDGFEKAKARCYVRVKIATPSPGANVIINGKSYGETPLSIQLPTSKYNIEIKQANQSLYNGELELEEGSKEKSLTLNQLNGQATLSDLKSIIAPNNGSGVAAQNNESGVSSRKERRSSSQERAQEQKQSRSERKSENRQSSESSGRESSRKRKTKRTKSAK